DDRRDDQKEEGVQKVAVIQSASVPFDADASTSKAERFIEQAATQGAKLVVFPEACIGGYPKGSAFGAGVGFRTPGGRAELVRYSQGAVTLDSPEAGRRMKASSD